MASWSCPVGYRPRLIGQALNVGWSNCERSTTWLTDNEDNHYALINIGGGVRLEIYIQAENHPDLHVGLVDLDDAGCAVHIRSCCDGWYARECNIPDINIDTDSTVIGNDEAEETSVVG